MLIPVNQSISYTKNCNNSLGFDYRNEVAGQHTLHILDMVSPYFLAAYTDSFPGGDRVTRKICGQIYFVERANHGLAHGLRQGALAKDICNLLVDYPLSDVSGIVEWAHRKMESDPQWIQKIEIAASFQRSGRQGECSSVSDPELYKKYEMQDTINFRNETQNDSLFTDEFERKVFEEAILWSNPGSLYENTIEDLKYIRRILHAAHTLDLRRMTSFDGDRIQRDAMNQLFGEEPPLESETIKLLFWKRSGDYLEATGDCDLVDQRDYQDRFFTQTHNPIEIVNAIHSISQKSFY